MATLDIRNRLPVPEMTGYTTANGVASYAYRLPGHVLWRGAATDGGRSVTSVSIHVEPADAIREAVAMLEGGRS